MTDTTALKIRPIRIALTLTVAALALLVSAPTAQAAKRVVDTVGQGGIRGGQFSLSSTSGIDVNLTGVGGVSPGAVYVAEGGNRRIQQLSPAGEFVRTWGMGVLTETATFEICESAGVCTGSPQSANTLAPLHPAASWFNAGIAVDQGTGLVYRISRVTPVDNSSRVAVFSAAGQPRGFFGFGVLNGSPQLQFCTASCHAAISGAGAAGELDQGGASQSIAVSPAGEIYVGPGNRRIDVFKPTVEGATVTGIDFKRAFGWDVAPEGAPGDTTEDEFEVCTTVCKTGSFGTGDGQFRDAFETRGPHEVALDPTGADLYTLERRSFNGSVMTRVQKFELDLTGQPTPLGDFGAEEIEDAFGVDVRVQSIATDPDSGNLLLAGSGEVTSGEVRILELDGDGDFVDLHGPDLPGSLGADDVRGIAATPAALGGNLNLLASGGGLTGYFVLADAKPEITNLECKGTSAKAEGRVFSDGKVVSYRFERSIDGKAWTRFPATDINVGPAPAEIDVVQETTGLTGSQPYRFRLIATRDGVPRTSDEETCTTEPAPPAISAGGVLADRQEAILKARVNPQNQPTSYHFEYKTQAAFAADGGWVPAERAPASGEAEIATAAPVTVARTITGLEPGTAYRARIVAANGTPPATEGAEQTFTTLPPYQDPNTGPCPNEALRGGPSAHLPDCRAYELVSPPGAAGLGNTSTAFVSDDGSRAVFSALAGFSGAQQNVLNHYRSTRGNDGWGTIALDPPYSVPYRPNNPSFPYNAAAGPRGFSRDFTRFYLDTQIPADPADTDYLSYDTYLREPGGSFKWVSNPPASGTFIGNSADGSHAVLAGGGNIYESVDGGPVRIVNLLPGGGIASNPLGGNWSPLHNGNALGAVSGDGRRIFFESDTGSEATTRLWVREDGKETRPIAGEAPGTVFAGATPDGTAVFFTTPAALVGTDANGAADLYRYNLDTDAYTRLSPDAVVGSPNPQVRRQLGVALGEKGDRVYFVASAVLTAEPNANGQSAAASQSNIYVWDRGEVRFVAAPQSGGGTAISMFVSGSAGSTPGIAPGAGPEWDLTPGGGKLAFLTSDALLPADGDSRVDVYVYDLAARSLVLATIGPLGGNGNFTADLGDAADERTAHSAHALSPDGRFLFFQTAERLVTRDVNGAVDVYERDLQTGRTWLISSGASSVDAVLVGVGRDGADVFFLDVRPLAPQDTDAARSLYTARIGGGFAEQAEGASCIGEACRPAVAATPSSAPPASSRIAGEGNLKRSVKRPKPRKCGKGKQRVVRAGKARCVKSKAKRKSGKAQRKRDQRRNGRSAR